MKFLDISTLTLNSVCATFILTGHLKQDKPGRKGLSTIVLNSFQHDERLDVLPLLRRYLYLTEPLRGTETQLFISFSTPYRPVSTDTLARWLKQVMASAGINVHKYKAHSIRAAATTSASTKDVPIREILDVAGWSSELTFAKFYKKPVEVSKGSQFSNAILHN